MSDNVETPKPAKRQRLYATEISFPDDQAPPPATKKPRKPRTPKKKVTEKVTEPSTATTEPSVETVKTTILKPLPTNITSVPVEDISDDESDDSCDVTELERGHVDSSKPDQLENKPPATYSSTSKQLRKRTARKTVPRAPKIPHLTVDDINRILDERAEKKRIARETVANETIRQAQQSVYDDDEMTKVYNQIFG